MLYLGLVKLTDGYGGVVKSCQQVSSDIAYFGCVAFETIENVFDMFSIQRKKTVLYLVYRNGFASDPDRWTNTGQGIKHEFYYPVYILLGVLLAKAEKINT